RADVTVPERLPESIPDLAVIRINGGGTGEAPAAAPAPPKPPFTLALALRIAAPGRVFVRGRGLDSEWRGDLAVAGTSAAPTITGSLQAVQGTYSLLGKDFALSRGVLSFAGGGKPDPLLDILAEGNSGGITAQILIGGTATAPTLKLTSQPQLPQDEVLAQLLFGHGLGQMTPLEGVQLAQAAASLAGGGGPDVLDKIRKGLGLDRLSIGSAGATDAASGLATAPGTTALGAQGQNATSGSTLSAGKYVAPGVYVGVEQGFTAGQSAVRVETEITPHVSLDAKAGAQNNESVGLNFKLDY
ncbi:MAG: translocation/assembly module TamB, partial [Alphaproteobacteria bacterium]|nr:translocation/assembly module TamB [Alphaproteobacteria bacterium]